jgi:hypothetical protein
MPGQPQIPNPSYIIFLSFAGLPSAMPSDSQTPKSEAEVPGIELSASLAAALDACSIEVLQEVLAILKERRETRPRSDGHQN